MWAIFKKELLTYFTSGSTYLVASLFLIVTSLLLWVMDNPFNIFQFGKASLEKFFELAPWLLVFLVPALTMRSLAEETASGTLEWLFTQAVSSKSILLGKFSAIKFLLLFLLLPTLVYLYTIQQIEIPKGSIDFGHLLSGYLGVFLLAVMFSAIGIFSSSLSSNQLVAYLIGLFICFILFFGIKGLATYNLINQNNYLVRRMGIHFHYDNFVRGIIDSRSVFYFVFLSILFLLASDLNISKRRK